MSFEPEHVEQHVDHRSVRNSSPDRRFGHHVHPRLQALEVRAALLVERHDLAVEHHAA
jgi:hypothetical protein